METVSNISAGFIEVVTSGLTSRTLQTPPRQAGAGPVKLISRIWLGLTTKELPSATPGKRAQVSEHKDPINRRMPNNNAHRFEFLHILVFDARI
jgi:hypothetical protein